MRTEIRIGDCLNLLQAMPDESVDCVVTSPPYWGLRDYGVDGQIGNEATLFDHIALLVRVFSEVRRVLKSDGTAWVNYGDCYANDGKWGGQSGRKNANSGAGGFNRDKKISGLKPKDLCMIANRLAIALQDDGWWVRSEIIWHKPNPMPESITDRPACQHEKVWLLSKSAKYFYDAAAVRRPMSDVSVARLSQEGSARANGGRKTNGKMKAVGKIDKQRGHSRRHAGFNDRWDAMGKDEQSSSAHLRNVWTIATASYADAHFATFPPALVEPCIMAGTREGGVVLDPFGGAGTTGLVAARLKRNCILLELNPEYAAMAHRRLVKDAGMFADVVAIGA